MNAIQVKQIRGRKTGSGAAVKELQAAAGPAVLLRLRATNVSGSTIYLQLHDASSAPADTAVPACPAVPLAAGAYYETDTPFTGDEGIYICASSTAATKTLVATDAVQIGAEVA